MRVTIRRSVARFSGPAPPDLIYDRDRWCVNLSFARAMLRLHRDVLDLTGGEVVRPQVDVDLCEDQRTAVAIAHLDDD